MISNDIGAASVATMSSCEEKAIVKGDGAGEFVEGNSSLYFILFGRSDHENLEISKKLGNEKPPILLDIEFSLWQALLAVATGTKTAVTAVTDFLETSVPWEELERVTEEERNFFLAGTNNLLKFKVHR